MSSSLIKLIDSAILPAAILIVSKVFGLYLAVSLFGLEWQIGYENNSIFSVYPVVFTEDLPIIASISDSVMILVMLLGLTITTFIAGHLHDTHVDPRTITKLARYNLLGFITTSYKIYHRASMWFIFTGIAVALGFYNFLTAGTILWVSLVGLIVYIAVSTILLKDVEAEIESRRKNMSFD